MAPSPQRLAESAESARELLRDCRLCPHDCGVDRTRGQVGKCGLDDRAHCFREMIGYNEEQSLTPSHQLYFSGCNLSCGFCTVAEWNREPAREPGMDPSQLLAAIKARRRDGAKTLNLLGGEPAVNAPGILALLARIDADVHVVWNSNMYFNPIVSDLISGIVDTYLADFKCGNETCARKLLGVERYMETVSATLRATVGMGRLIVRHLLLPGHLECCAMPVLRRIAREIPAAKVSLRDNYVPPYPRGRAPDGYGGGGALGRAEKFARTLGLELVR